MLFRSAGDLRHYFDKFGGNLGQSGCVAFMFAPKGVIIIENDGLDEEKVMEDCVSAGAVDINFEEEAIEVFTDPTELRSTREALEAKGYKFASAEVEHIPSTYSTIEDGDLAVKMNKLLDALDDNDDVQNVWHNWEDNA